MTLTLVPVVGALGMGAEATNWFLTQRAIQNAADAAVIAAATNNCDEGAACDATQANYKQEARSVANQFGFLHVTGGDTNVDPDIAPCKSPATGNCYQVEITRKVPFYLLKILGFEGNTTTLDGGNAQSIYAVAQAKRFPGSTFCVTALGNGNSNSTYAIRLNGGPNTHFENCDAFAPNSGAWCASNNAQTAFRSAYVLYSGFNQACPSPSAQADTTDPTVFDAKESLISSVCTPGAHSTSVTVLTLASQVNGCKNGDVRISGDLDITTAQTLVIYDGTLDLNGYKLSTSGSGSLTIIFTSEYATGVPNSHTETHNYAITSSTNARTATLDIRAPTSGNWSGIAIYQDPSLVSGGKVDLDFNYQSSKVNLKYSGLLYARKALINTNGNSTISYSSMGEQCLAIIAFRVEVSGAVNANTTGCTAAGLTNLPKVYNLVNLVA